MIDPKVFSEEVVGLSNSVVTTLVDSGQSRGNQVSALALTVYCYMKSMHTQYGDKQASLENQCERLFKTIHEIEQSKGQDIIDFIGGIGGNKTDNP